MSMKTDRLCAPLRAKGVSAVFGWSESVTSEGDCLDLSILTDLLCSRQTLAEAFVNMKKTVGCEWDPTWIDYTYDQAHNYAVAFPIVVSEEDEYPGQGNVNIIQTVKSTWKLPVRSDVPEKQVISLNTQYTNYVVAETRNKITNVTIAAGGLPKGMTMSYEENRVVLNGKPTEKGYAVATYKITTEKKETITKPVGILTADYSKVTSLSKSVEVTAPNYDKWSFGAFLDASDESEKNTL